MQFLGVRVGTSGIRAVIHKADGLPSGIVRLVFAVCPVPLVAFQPDEHVESVVLLVTVESTLICFVYDEYL